MLSQQRKGEIAIAILMAKIRTQGIKIEPGMVREWGNIAKETGIPLSEIMEFFREVVLEVTASILTPKDSEANH